MLEVELTPDQQALVQHAIDSGRLADVQAAVGEALSLWEARERRRLEILALVDEAEASLADGSSYPLTPEAMAALVDEVERRGRARLASQDPPAA